MKNHWLLLAILSSVLHGTFVQAEQTNASRLAINQPETQTTQQLRVRSETFGHLQAIPEQNSSYGQSISPHIAWSAGPSSTRSYALILEDADGIRDDKPIVHWVVYNIAADTTHLPTNLPAEATLGTPVSLLQGLTIRGTPGYVGPRPRAGDAPHHYHFQLFALDTRLELQPGASREELLDAIQGHVLAKGELVGTYLPPAP